MELDFKHASLQEIIDYAPDLRREAYVDATLRMHRIFQKVYFQKAQIAIQYLYAFLLL